MYCLIVPSISGSPLHIVSWVYKIQWLLRWPAAQRGLRCYWASPGRTYDGTRKRFTFVTSADPPLTEEVAIPATAMKGISMSSAAPASALAFAIAFRVVVVRRGNLDLVPGLARYVTKIS